jgi:hypothetical protein
LTGWRELVNVQRSSFIVALTFPPIASNDVFGGIYDDAE